MKTHAYLNHIDGIRAGAVLSVILFHLWPGQITGGFVGVDVFFVISGFLITGLINRELKTTQSFDFVSFFKKRVKRLYPALIFTILFSLLCSFILLLPTYYNAIGLAALSATVSVSNIYFWQTIDYFNDLNFYEPLLHTWSLGVEEQFYILLPLLMLAGYKIKQKTGTIIALMACVGLASFAINFVYSHHTEALFFLMPFRIFEFFIGGFLFFFMDKKPIKKHTLKHEGLLLLGASIVASCVFLFDEDLFFPGYYALIPCIGTALLIYAGQDSPYIGFFLKNPISVYLGKISYSLYLIHWPIIVISKHVLSLQEFEKIWLLPVCFVLACLMYHFIEQPFRKGSFVTGRLNNTPMRYFAFATLITCALSAGLAFNTQWNWKLSTGQQQALSVIDNTFIDRPQYYKKWEDILEGRPFDLRDMRPKIMVIGDSHSYDLAIGLYQSTHSDVFQIRRFFFDDRCQEIMAEKVFGSTCDVQRQDLETLNSIKNADHILYAPRWDPSTISGLSTFLGALPDDLRRKFVIVNWTAEFDNVPNYIYRHSFMAFSPESIVKDLFTSQRATIMTHNNILRAIAEAHDLPLLDRHALVCKDIRAVCDVIVPGVNKVGIWDYGHWTEEGALYYASKLDLSPLMRP